MLLPRSLALALALALALPVVAAEEAGEGEGLFGLPNASRPEDGLLFAGQPDAEQLENLAEGGYKVVVDLRMPDEDRGFDEEKVAAELGLTYISIPVGSETLDRRGTFDEFFATLKAAERPILVHCGSGNRVGGLYYAYLVVEEELPVEEALETAKANGLRRPTLIDRINAYLEETTP